MANPFLSVEIAAPTVLGSQPGFFLKNRVNIAVFQNLPADPPPIVGQVDSLEAFHDHGKRRA
jgi:hypothetical protein